VPGSITALHDLDATCEQGQAGQDKQCLVSFAAWLHAGEAQAVNPQASKEVAAERQNTKSVFCHISDCWHGRCHECGVGLFKKSEKAAI